MPSVKKNQGFSLIELLISLGTLLVVSSSAFTLLSYYQKSYISMEQRSDVHSGIRAAMALMTQEIAQAGSLGLKPKKLQDDMTKSTSLQSVTLLDSVTGNASADDVFDKEKFVIGTGTLQEVVEVESHTST